jgi:cell pole-organizing protein PopZ
MAARNFDCGREDGMTQAAKAQEPSMEEILASIRRIIADDDASKVPNPPEPAPPPAAAAPSPPPPPPEPAAADGQGDVDALLRDMEGALETEAEPELETEPAPEPPPSDVLELTEANVAPTPGPAPSFRTIDGDSDVVFTERAPEPPPPPREPPPRMAEEPRPAPFTDRALLSQHTAAAVDSAFNSLASTVLGQNARTLEDLVKEMLRPMLKNWLDDNLPGLVERIVRAEIERVSRGKP